MREADRGTTSEGGRHFLLWKVLPGREGEISVRLLPEQNMKVKGSPSQKGRDYEAPGPKRPSSGSYFQPLKVFCEE